ESWNETFIQLWDVDEPDAEHMPVAKFIAIIDKVTGRVAVAPGGKLTFEVGDGASPMQLYRVDAIGIEGDTVRIALVPRAAGCKPRDRWLTRQHTAPAP